jgi:hypothetical protein
VPALVVKVLFLVTLLRTPISWLGCGHRRKGVLRLALTFLACYLGLNPIAKAAEITASPIPTMAETALVTIDGVLESADAAISGRRGHVPKGNCCAPEHRREPDRGN